MNLKELLEKASPLPWNAQHPMTEDMFCSQEEFKEYLSESPPITRIVGSDESTVATAHDLFKFTPENAALIVHAVNILPELVEALEAAWYAMEKHARSECSREITTALAVLKKATTINIKKGN